MKNSLLLFLFLFSLPHGRDCFAQNLVPNPSFEQYDTCPDFASQISRAVGWYSSQPTCDYFNSCSPGYNWCTVPFNYFGYRTPASGNSYAGIISYWQSSGAREIIGGQLISPLQIGLQYYVSFKISLAGQANPSQYCGINKLGILFSTIPYSNANPPPICNCAQMYSDSIVTDTLNWTMLTGSFIADSAYTYINIGRLFSNAMTDSIQVAGSGCNAYYYLDDICVSTDSLTCNPLLENIKENIFTDGITLFPNPTSNILNLSFPTFVDAEVSIYDRLGRQVFSTTVRNHPELTINLGAFSPGVYLLKLVSEKDGRAVVRKVVKL